MQISKCKPVYSSIVVLNELLYHWFSASLFGCLAYGLQEDISFVGWHFDMSAFRINDHSVNAQLNRWQSAVSC